MCSGGGIWTYWNCNEFTSVSTVGKEFGDACFTILTTYNSITSDRKSSTGFMFVKGEPGVSRVRLVTFSNKLCCKKSVMLHLISSVEGNKDHFATLILK